MSGANAERTSWTPEEVRGFLFPEWYRPIDAYIPQKVQIIAEYNTLYISTAKGLFALDSDTGLTRWYYPTELPLGNSPTIYQGIAYVGGFDRKLHAIDAFSGDLHWTFEAGAGFDTNPLIVNDIVYLGNRDGYFYAISASEPNMGQLLWKFQTEGPINYSAAYKDGVVYFASNDSHAYALSAFNGELIWKSEKLPGAGFHSWWPVIYRDKVIFSGSRNYRNKYASPGGMPPWVDVFPNHENDPVGTLVGPIYNEPGDWVDGTITINTSLPTITENGSTIPITQYLSEKPWQRTYFVLDRFTGTENTYDFNNDGSETYAPILWFGTYSGNRYPPVVGSDGVIYQANKYMSAPWLPGGQISGWKEDTPFISIVTSDWTAMDEPTAFSAGGNIIYTNLCCDRKFLSIDISKPSTIYPHRDNTREWRHFDYNLSDKIPDYNVMTYVTDPYHAPQGGAFGGQNGSYGWHGDVNPPIPYQGRVYMHRSNAIIAFSPLNTSPKILPLAQSSQVSDTLISPDPEELKTRLSIQIQKIINAGHLKPGFLPSSASWIQNTRNICGDDFGDYWHNPSETIYTLIQALPYLSEPLRQQTKDYIQTEFESYPPYEYNHIGWADGSQREIFELPPEAIQDMPNFPARHTNDQFVGWDLNPFNFYSIWKYAQVFGNANYLYEMSKDKLETTPPNDVLLEMPFVTNAYIAGYIGFLELEKLAGMPESTEIRNEMERLMMLRATSFDKDVPESYLTEREYRYCRSLNVSRNFLFLVPELASFLNQNAYAEVYQAINEYEYVAPYWFVSRFEGIFGEGVIYHVYDYHSLFQAKALILNESREHLWKYLDIPAFFRGDLYYIQNLISAIEAENL